MAPVSFGPLTRVLLRTSGSLMKRASPADGGGLCSATNHSHHKGLLDSQYWQMRLQAENLMEATNDAYERLERMAYQKTQFFQNIRASEHRVF